MEKLIQETEDARIVVVIVIVIVMVSMEERETFKIRKRER